jgi:hypothetical protein
MSLPAIYHTFITTPFSLSLSLFLSFLPPVRTIQKRQVFLVSVFSSIFYLAAVTDFLYDCRVFHQMVETCFAILCTLLVVLMRKLIGRLKLKTRGRHGTGVVTVTVIQKGLLGAAALTFTMEVFVYGEDAKVAIRVAKTVCWAGILANAACHFMWYILDLGDVFKGISISDSRKGQGNSRSQNQSQTSQTRQKGLRVKQNLRANMGLNISCVFIFVLMYCWWPEGKDGFGCAPRPHSGIFMARITVATIGGVTAHASLLHTIWNFKNKRKVKVSATGNNAKAQPPGNHGRRQHWYVKNKLPQNTT